MPGWQNRCSAFVACFAGRLAENLLGLYRRDKDQTPTSVSAGSGRVSKRSRTGPAGPVVNGGRCVMLRNEYITCPELKDQVVSSHHNGLEQIASGEKPNVETGGQIRTNSCFLFRRRDVRCRNGLGFAAKPKWSVCSNGRFRCTSFCRSPEIKGVAGEERQCSGRVSRPSNEPGGEPEVARNDRFLAQGKTNQRTIVAGTGDCPSTNVGTTDQRTSRHWQQRARKVQKPASENCRQTAQKRAKFEEPKTAKILFTRRKTGGGGRWV